METKRFYRSEESWQDRLNRLFEAGLDSNEPKDDKIIDLMNLMNVRKYFKENYDFNYISALSKVFGSSDSLEESFLSDDEIRSLVEKHPQLLEYNIKVERNHEEEYYDLFLKYVDNASRYCTKLAENSQNEYHAYEIVGIEVAKDMVIKEHGEYVYSRAYAEVPFVMSDGKEERRDFRRAERRLCCLVDENTQRPIIIDLDAYRRYLGYKGITTSVDYDRNTFTFGKIPHMLKKSEAQNKRLELLQKKSS